jgi:uncharacterized membrane protein YdbT with pleckstrin-like domain
MSEVHYDAYPTLLRQHPFASLVGFLILLLAITVVWLGAETLPALWATYLPAMPPMRGVTLQYIAIVIFLLVATRLYAWYVPSRFDRLRITDEELVWTRGFLAKQHKVIALGSVREVQVKQTPLQRLMDGGDVSIYSNEDQAALTMRGLPEPQRVRELVEGRMAAPAAAPA